MRCAKCGSEAAEIKKFCADCGAAFVPRDEAVPVPGEAGAYFCHRHKKEPTRVTCGRCEAPVCTKCAVYGPVGVRCRECAKNRVPIRPMGVLHGAGQAMDTPAGRTVWYMAVWFFVVNLFTHLFGGDDS